MYTVLTPTMTGREYETLTEAIAFAERYQQQYMSMRQGTIPVILIEVPSGFLVSLAEAKDAVARVEKLLDF